MFIDTSVLVRTLQPHHPLYSLAKSALDNLTDEGRELFVVAQNLIEFWAVATRPKGENGLGLSTIEAGVELDRIKGIFQFLPETPAIYPAWELLVKTHAVSGRPTHDARLAAAMQVHGITDILTFDKTGFTRFPGINAIHPADIMPTRQ